MPREGILEPKDVSGGCHTGVLDFIRKGCLKLIKVKWRKGIGIALLKITKEEGVILVSAFFADSSGSGK